LPNRYLRKDDRLDEDIIGSQIISIGGIRDTEYFGISYRTKNGIIKTVIIEYDETGMWLR